MSCLLESRQSAAVDKLIGKMITTKSGMDQTVSFADEEGLRLALISLAAELVGVLQAGGIETDLHVSSKVSLLDNKADRAIEDSQRTATSYATLRSREGAAFRGNAKGIQLARELRDKQNRVTISAADGVVERRNGSTQEEMI